MKVSIITATYNRERTLGDAIESIFEQDYPEIEYILVDGKSTDGTMDVVRRAQERVQTEEFRWLHPGFEMKVLSEPDHGMYEALNKGIRMATGDVIAVCHSDDMLYDSKVVTDMVRRMKETRADFVYADGLFVKADAPEVVVRRWIGGAFEPSKVRRGWLPLHPTCYIRKEVFSRVGMYDEGYKIASDTDLLLRILLCGVEADGAGESDEQVRVSYLKDRYVVRMRMQGLSTNFSNIVRMWREDVSIYRHNGFTHPVMLKVQKMARKVPQFIMAKVGMDVSLQEKQ